MNPVLVFVLSRYCLTLVPIAFMTHPSSSSLVLAISSPSPSIPLGSRLPPPQPVYIPHTSHVLSSLFFSFFLFLLSITYLYLSSLSMFQLDVFSSSVASSISYVIHT